MIQHAPCFVCARLHVHAFVTCVLAMLIGCVDALFAEYQVYSGSSDFHWQLGHYHGAALKRLF